MRNRSVFDVELSIAKLLRYGVLFAAALMVVGWCGSLSTARPFAAFEHYEPMSLANGLEAAYLAGDWGKLVSYAGLFVLVLLPSLRVFFSAVLFGMRREYRMAAIALFVLCALAVSFSMGIETE